MVGGGASINAKGRAGFACQLLKRGFVGLLDGVVDELIVRPAAQVFVERQKAGVLAGAVVVNLAGALIGLDQRLTRDFVTGGLRAAAQVIIHEVEVFEPASHAVGVDRGGVVGGAGERQMLRRQTESIGCTAFNKRQRLDHFAGRAGIDDGIGIAPSLHNLATLVTDDRVALVDGLQKVAAPHLYHIDRTSHFAPIPCVSILAAIGPSPHGHFFARSMGIELKLNVPVEKLGVRPSVRDG